MCMCRIRSEKIVRNKILKAYLLKAETKLYSPFFCLFGFCFGLVGCFWFYFVFLENGRKNSFSELSIQNYNSLWRYDNRKIANMWSFLQATTFQ